MLHSISVSELRNGALLISHRNRFSYPSFWKRWSRKFWLSFHNLLGLSHFKHWIVAGLKQLRGKGRNDRNETAKTELKKEKGTNKQMKGRVQLRRDQDVSLSPLPLQTVAVSERVEVKEGREQLSKACKGKSSAEQGFIFVLFSLRCSDCAAFTFTNRN